MRVLSVDPGIGTTGFSILDSQKQSVSLIAYGTIKSNPEDQLPKRLNYIYEEINKIFDQFSPKILAIEDAFYSKNVKSAMVLGQARGSVILAGAQSDIPIYEFAPRKVKMSICGNGSATKEQVHYMVRKILRIKDNLKSLDITDAIAVGLCYINQNKYT